MPVGEHITYLLLDEMTNQHASIWPEISADEANEATIVQWIIVGQFRRPLKIVAKRTCAAHKLMSATVQ